MARGGYAQLPDGSVIVALSLPRPADAARQARPARTTGATLPAPRRWSAPADEPHTVREAAEHREEPAVRVLVRAGNRARALTRLRNLGLRAVYLSGNTEPPTPDEITAVLHHPDGLLWRAGPHDGIEPWHPITSLIGARRRAPTS
jgi:hypothetical protein